MDNTVGSQQQNIITGTLLGDGFLERNGVSVRLVADHSATQEAYVRWKAKGVAFLYPSIVLKSRIDPRTHRTYYHCILRTHTSPLLERYVSLFYKGKQKHVPELLPEIINPQMLALWCIYHLNQWAGCAHSCNHYSSHQWRINLLDPVTTDPERVR